MCTFWQLAHGQGAAWVGTSPFCHALHIVQASRVRLFQVLGECAGCWAEGRSRHPYRQARVDTPWRCVCGSVVPLYGCMHKEPHTWHAFFIKYFFKQAKCRRCKNRSFPRWRGTIRMGVQGLLLTPSSAFSTDTTTLTLTLSRQREREKSGCSGWLKKFKPKNFKYIGWG